MTSALAERTLAKRRGSGRWYVNLPTQRVMVDRIVRTVREATPRQYRAGVRWYARWEYVAECLADAYGVDVVTAAGVLAWTSPRQGVRENVRTAAAVLRGDDRVDYLAENVDKARAVAGGDLSTLELDSGRTLTPSRKVRSFFRNGLGDVDLVTVDVWAARVVGYRRRDGQPSGGEYVAIEHAYRLAARRLGMTPREVQAVAWVVERERSVGGDVEAESLDIVAEVRAWAR